MTEFFTPWHKTWYDNNGWDIVLYFKGIIDNQVPPAGVPTGLTDKINVYGCVIRCQNPVIPKDSKQFSHVTKASNDFFISGLPQPNLN